MTAIHEQFPVPPEYLEAVKAHGAAMRAHRDALEKFLASMSETDCEAVDAAREGQRQAKVRMLALEPDWLKPDD